MSKTTRVLFVCLGNICRSPLAEGIFDHLVHQAGLSSRYEIDSCGTGGYHAGERAHPGSREVASKNGITLTSISRKLIPGDFSSFDLLVAMDRDNASDMRRSCPAEHESKIKLLRSWDPEGGHDVPDPYYEGGFPNVYTIVERSCRALLEDLEGA